MIPKFRAYITYGFSLQLGFIDTPDLIDFKNQRVKYDSEWYENDRFRLMQSTGLFDKNGVEIYEGDIVIAWSQGVKGIFEIKRRIDGLWLLYPAWKDRQFWYLRPTEDGRETIEVLGNIYENPELLEKR